MNASVPPPAPKIDAGSVTSAAQAQAAIERRIPQLMAECSNLTRITTKDEEGITERIGLTLGWGKGSSGLAANTRHAIRTYVANVWEYANDVQKGAASSDRLSSIRELVGYGNEQLGSSVTHRNGPASLIPIAAREMLEECGQLWEDWNNARPDGAPHKTEIAALIPQYRTAYETVLGHMDFIREQLAIIDRAPHTPATGLGA